MRIAHRAASFAVLAAVVALGGCNTIRGLGQDTQAGGRAVERTANETQQQIEERQRREQENSGSSSTTTTPPPTR